MSSGAQSACDAVVVGAGVGGLSAALRLAGAGAGVQLLEAHAKVGGKMRQLPAGDQWIDAGPTVLTMRHVFEELWAQAGLDFASQVPTEPLSVLARHRWPDQSELDLFADEARTHAAISAFSSPKEAQAFVDFHQRCQRILRAVQAPFMDAPRAGLRAGLSQVGLSGLVRLGTIQWHRTLWDLCGSYFQDQRLRQLFARYATYFGSDPFQAPGTLSLIAGVELAGVWRVKGGMHTLAAQTALAAQSLGAQLHCEHEVVEILCDAKGVSGVRCRNGHKVATRNLVYNGSLGRLYGQLLPSPLRRRTRSRPRSLSAVTLTGLGSCKGLDLAWHNVCFSANYAREFEEIFKEGRVPHEPTAYICAQDSGQASSSRDRQRLFALINAPARGDDPEFSPTKSQCLEALERVTSQCGIQLNFCPSTLQVTTPAKFEQIFPGTGGALYGPATHGWWAAFARPSTPTKIPGLFVVGGQVHPGAGVPMVTLGGRHAADCVMARLGLTLTSRKAAMRGGTSTPSAAVTDTPSP